jgi:hypothetical protein
LTGLKRMKLPAAVVTAVMLVGLLVPAMSSASSLKKPEGSLVPTGSLLKLVSSEAETKFGAGSTTCSALTSTLSVSQNNGKEVAANAPFAPTLSSCSVGESEFWVKWLTAPTGSGHGTLLFEQTLYSLVNKTAYCHIRAIAPFTYVAGSNSISVETSSFETVSGAVCEQPHFQPVSFRAKFNLSLSTGALVSIW